MGKLNLVTVIILICAIVRNVMGIITAAMKYQIDKTLYNLPENYTCMRHWSSCCFCPMFHIDPTIK